MFERLRDIASAFKIDREMERIVRSGIPGRYTAEGWGNECLFLARARRTGQIDALIFRKLSPAAKELLPKIVVIK